MSAEVETPEIMVFTDSAANKVRELIEDRMYPLTLQGLEDGMKYLSK